MAPHSRSLFTTQTAQSARAIALSLLVESDTSEEGVDVLLERALAPCSFDSRERALTVELTYGVLRRRATIDWRLEPVLDKPLLRLPGSEPTKFYFWIVFRNLPQSMNQSIWPRPLPAQSAETGVGSLMPCCARSCAIRPSPGPT
jgi:hypothetical protein